MVSGEEVRVPDSPRPEDLALIVARLQSKIELLEKEFQAKGIDTKEDREKLKRIDIKDLEKPDKYDNNISKFRTWFDKFRDLLSNRHANWYKLLQIIEKQDKETIKNQEEFSDKFDEEHDQSYKYIKAQAEMYAHQL